MQGYTHTPRSEGRLEKMGKITWRGEWAGHAVVMPEARTGSGIVNCAMGAGKDRNKKKDPLF